MDLRERADDASAVRHPWETVRAEFFAGIVRRLPHGEHVRALDVGAGDGWLAEGLLCVLPQDTEIVCWDINYTDEDLGDVGTSGRIHRVREAPAGRFDVVLLLDVLEHIADDAGFLDREIVPRLNPDAHLVVSVPVHPSLYTEHDSMLGHERRYRIRAIRELLGRRFTIVDEGSIFTSLLPVRLAEKLKNRVRPSEAKGIGAWTGGPALTGAITGVLRGDAWVNAQLARTPVRLPGLSYWCVCRPASTPET